MKKVALLILTIFLMLNTPVLQAQNKQVKQSWKHLKAQLSKKAVIAKELSTEAKRFGMENSQLLNLNNLFADSIIIKSSASSKPDRSSVQEIKRINEGLSNTIDQVFETLESSGYLKSQHSLQDLMIQLEGIENRIAVARRDYNRAATGTGRKDLALEAIDDGPPQVEF